MNNNLTIYTSLSGVYMEMLSEDDKFIGEIQCIRYGPGLTNSGVTIAGELIFKNLNHENYSNANKILIISSTKKTILSGVEILIEGYDSKKDPIVDNKLYTFICAEESLIL